MCRTNAEVAAVFSRLADYLEIAGENPFKTRAYRNAAATLVALAEPVSVIAREGRLSELPGFGQAIAAKTQDILETGTTPALDRVREQIPEGALEMLALSGVGVKTAGKLWEGLRVDSLASLELAAREGRVRLLKGMSEKLEKNILHALERHKKYAGLMRLDAATELAADLLATIAGWEHVTRTEIAGDLRRSCETISSVSFVVISHDPERTTAAFQALAGTLGKGIEADLTLAEPSTFGMALIASTGSPGHVARLKGIGVHMDYPAPEEEAVYGHLGLPWIAPVLREDRGEIEAALNGALPKLIQLEDIRGNIHQHTMASDGRNTIVEMAAAGAAMGYEYMAITDHSRALAMTNGLTVERLRQQIRDVREAEQSAGIGLLAGSEVDILADGTMDFPDDVLAELDIVIGSVHSRFNLSREEMTARVLKAVDNPHVDFIGHPTGRLINSRDPFELDIDAVIEAAAATNTALEINASPERLDLNEWDARKAAQAGVRLAINTDAHHTSHLGLMKYGVSIAQRAWVEAAQVVNAWPYSELMAWLRR
jgi:DNA polymerase (family 10)